MPRAGLPPSTMAHQLYHGCPVFPDVYGPIITGASVDSAVKLCVDALQAVVYPNDRFVSRITAQKGSDAGKPRVEVTVELLRAV